MEYHLYGKHSKRIWGFANPRADPCPYCLLRSGTSLKETTCSRDAIWSIRRTAAERTLQISLHYLDNLHKRSSGWASRAISFSPMKVSSISFLPPPYRVAAAACSATAYHFGGELAVRCTAESEESTTSIVLRFPRLSTYEKTNSTGSEMRYCTWRSADCRLVGPALIQVRAITLCLSG